MTPSTVDLTKRQASCTPITDDEASAACRQFSDDYAPEAARLLFNAKLCLISSQSPVFYAAPPINPCAAQIVICPFALQPDDPPNGFTTSNRIGLPVRDACNTACGEFSIMSTISSFSIAAGRYTGACTCPWGGPPEVERFRSVLPSGCSLATLESEIEYVRVQFENAGAVTSTVGGTRPGLNVVTAFASTFRAVPTFTSEAAGAHPVVAMGLVTVLLSMLFLQRGL
ncbi:hypothetical protein HDU67_008126 [Dinochytrium kinnereticum]|nr:hypothetical protein HDU67_008126 [Dinochytrium kinnereticum]